MCNTFGIVQSACVSQCLNAIDCHQTAPGLFSNSQDILYACEHYGSRAPVQLRNRNVACAWERRPQEPLTAMVSGAIPQHGTTNGLLGLVGRNTGAFGHILNRTIGTELHLPNGKMRGLLKSIIHAQSPRERLRCLERRW